MALGYNGRTPSSSRDNSNVGGVAAFGGSGGGGRARVGGGSGGGGPLPPPPPLTGTPRLMGTPRRTREKTILLDEIGRGGGGTVHKALHVPSMRLVAVKMVEVHDDEKRHQILQELKTLISMKPVQYITKQYAIWLFLCAGGGGGGTKIGSKLERGRGEYPRKLMNILRLVSQCGDQTSVTSCCLKSCG